jgi:GxxExxY protein
MTENEVAEIIVDAAFTVHSRLGPGLLESVYEAVMEYELTKRGLDVVHQRPMPVIYDEVRMKVGFRPDLIVAGKVIIEVKSVEVIAPVHDAIANVPAVGG